MLVRGTDARAQRVQLPQNILQTRGFAVTPKNRTDSRGFYKDPSKFKKTLIGTAFINANGDRFGPSYFNKWGLVLMWHSGTVYHVSMCHKTDIKFNNGFGFHVKDERDPVHHYYFDRFGNWVETTMTPKGKRPITISKKGNKHASYDKLPSKVQTVASAFKGFYANFML